MKKLIGALALTLTIALSTLASDGIIIGTPDLTATPTPTPEVVTAAAPTQSESSPIVAAAVDTFVIVAGIF